MAKKSVTQTGSESTGAEPESGIHAVETESWQAERDRLGARKFTFTLAELCDAVGHEVHPHTFAAEAFEAIADQIEAEAIVSEEEGGRSRQLLSISSRARFAASICAELVAEPLSQSEAAE